ncbi:MAG: pesticidal protein Cry7Aa [Flavobacteriaceae bacterium]|nr:pesticidal protein Cry7Aa [Flavobacteriaceae bacterium]
MINVEKLGIILSSTQREFENIAVTNPGIYQDNNTVHILYSATGKDHVSSIGYAYTEGPQKIIERNEKPIIKGELEYELKGVKNARIVKIEDTFYITYTSCDGNNQMGALATSKDLKEFQKHGVITPCISYEKYGQLIKNKCQNLSDKYFDHFQFFNRSGMADDSNTFLRDKELIFFPKKINGQFVMLNRIYPSIQIVYFNHWEDLTISFWEEYLKNLTDYIVFEPDGVYEIGNIGLGCPPIETNYGWLLIYHSVQITATGNVYHVRAALLQIDEPQKILSKLYYPLFSPTQHWEKEDELNLGSLMPSGTAIFGDDLYIYYGASEKYVALAKLSLNELLIELVKKFDN